MSRDSITFLDIPSAISNPTSPNTWKVRLALNYKGLAYHTKWVPTADIETVCKSLGIPPTATKANGDPHYTLPALIDRTIASKPVILSDSTPIIEYLEKAYPSSPAKELFPKETTALQILFTEFALPRILAFVPSLAIMALYNSKPPRDQADFRKRTEATFGKKLEEIEKQGSDREAAYKELEMTFAAIVRALKKNDGGTFITSKGVSFADCSLGGILIFLRMVSPDDVWARMAQWEDGFWARYLSDFKDWMAVDNHPGSVVKVQPKF